MVEIVNPSGGEDIPRLGGFKYTWTEINPNEVSDITDFPFNLEEVIEDKVREMLKNYFVGKVGQIQIVNGQFEVGIYEEIDFDD